MTCDISTIKAVGEFIIAPVLAFIAIVLISYWVFRE